MSTKYRAIIQHGSYWTKYFLVYFSIYLVYLTIYRRFASSDRIDMLMRTQNW